MTFHSATCTLSLPLTLSFLKQYLNHFHYYVDHRLKLRVTTIIAFAKHLRDFLNILITHNDCFHPKFPPLFGSPTGCAGLEQTDREESEPDQPIPGCELLVGCSMRRQIACTQLGLLSIILSVPTFHFS